MGNPVVHFEIGCRDSKKTQEFYCGLFDWKFESTGPVVMINTGEVVNGHISALGHEPHHYTWMQDPEGNTVGLFKPAL